MSIPKMAKVILFKSSGKYYTEEEWRIPEEVPDHSEMRGDYVRKVLGPYDMRHSLDFRRIDGGAVLVETQEPWGYPHLFPSEAPEPVVQEPERIEFTGQLMGGPDHGNLVTATVERFEHHASYWSWLDGPGQGPSEIVAVRGWYRWDAEGGVFRWELQR
jgi:hypothetical protein